METNVGARGLEKLKLDKFLNLVEIFDTLIWPMIKF